MVLVRAPFLLTPLLVVAQLAMIHARYGEPYPAIMMPAFGGTLATPAGNIAIESGAAVVRFTDGSTARATLRALLAEMPVSHHWVVGTTMFRHTPIEAGSVPPRSALKGWIIEHVTPIRARWAERRRRGNPVEPETQEWLARRVAAMYPAKAASSVEFEWMRHEYRVVDGRAVLIDESTTERYAVALDYARDQ